MEITKEYRFEYAHRLQHHDGLCKNLHGHSGKAVITFSGLPRKDTGMIVDFQDFGWVKKVVDEMDHTLVLQVGDPVLHVFSEALSLRKIVNMRIVAVDDPPTAEVLCGLLAKKINDALIYNVGTKGLILHSVSFYETEKNYVTLVY
jgi:6-pyruvoyltetrahydropterin/6-carboxytetrahydropterin synthase